MLYIRGEEINKATLAKKIDGSLLNPFTTKEEIQGLIKMSLEYNTNSICVNPNYLDDVIEACKNQKGTDVKSCVVIDYPFGTSTLEDKVAMAKDAVARGVEIIDFVIDYGHLKSGDKDHLVKEVKACVEAAQGRETRFIIEVCYLTEDEIVKACEAVIEGGGDFVKTSTGRFGGPDMRIIDLMVKTVAGRCKLKIAGTGEFWRTSIALNTLAAGFDIIGTRSAKSIVDELPIFESIVKNFEVK
ncbi:MAG: deoxyribose-phosphate aldolase [Lachnospiraceae bacterium]|nr:deoxyribose-phosphate aldolase [Lachnospiraceae bacterium]